MELMYLNLEWLGELESVLCSGTGVDMHARLQGERDWSVYQAAMRDAARLQAPSVARHVPLRRGAARLLDVGGSHGYFAAALCRRRPELRAEVLDLPAALPAARRLGRDAGLGDRLRHRAGDALRDDLGRGWDAIFFGNLLHHFQPEQNRDLLRRARAAARPGGVLAVWDLERPPPGRAPNLIGDGMALLFRVTSSAAVYAAEDYVGWLREAGCRRLRQRRLVTAPGQVLITATC
jgi:SAM-dependent methyltransferase